MFERFYRIVLQESKDDERELMKSSINPLL